MPDTHLPLHRAPTTEQLFPTLTGAQMARIATHFHVSLTLCERQVMALFASGLLNKQVAGELSISEITVKAHRGQVMRKMTAGSSRRPMKMDARLQLAPATSFATDTIVQ